MVAIAASLFCAASFGSVFDDAKMWWKFDNGGANGAVVQASEIHDARNASQGVSTAVYGSQGGPLWAKLNVRLPNQKKTVNSTALYLPCDLRNNNGTAQYYSANALFSGTQMHGDNVTVVARIRLESNEISSSDLILWNNAFHWNNKFGSAFGFIKTKGTRGPGTTYFPYAFIATNTFGNAAVDQRIPLKVGEWYDIAYLYSVDEIGGTRYDNVTYVVAGDSGVRTYTIRKPSTRVTSATTTYGRLGVMNENKGWDSYNATTSSNTGDKFKNFNGWIHQLALWERTLTLDEVLEAFGTPAANDMHDIYAEAANWWRFDSDLNADGIVQTNEIRDVRHWDSMSECSAVAVKQLGPSGGPLWTNMNVYLPGKGVEVRSDCLYFPIATNIYANASGQTIYQAFPTVLTLPNAARSGSYTVVARIYPERLVSGPGGYDACIFNNALDWNSCAGSTFGLNSGSDKTGNTFYPRACLAHTWYQATHLTMRTNTWYDIAFSVTDNGYDAEGNALTDSLLIAVCDKEYGLRYETQNIDTNAYTFYGSWAGYSQMGEQEQYKSLADFWNATTTKGVSSGNPAKAFRGMIHQLAIWDRALTIDEIASAFSHPNNMVMGTGTADGASGEFATSGGSYDYTLGENWHQMASKLDSEHPELTIRFTPEANNLSLVHMLHVRTAAVGTADGQTATLTLGLNGMTLATAQEVGAYGDLWCMVPKNRLAAGSNALTIVHAGGASVSLDNVEIIGSWQVGIEDNSDHELSPEGGYRHNVFTLGNRNLKSKIRAILPTGTYKTSSIRFYVPPGLAKHAFKFTTRQFNLGDNGPWDFHILLNGTEKYRTPTGGLDEGDYASFDVAAGELQSGWNTVDFEHLGSVWVSFDFFRMAISDYPPGMVIILR